MLAMAEQKLVSTSKEHKVLDPTWQEMLNQAVLKVRDPVLILFIMLSVSKLYAGSLFIIRG